MAWKCPLCHKSAVVSELFIDPIFQQLLNMAGRETQAITLTCDGNYSFKTSTSSNQQSSDSQKKQSDVIDLISDDEGEEAEEQSLSQDEVCAVDSGTGEQEVAGTISSLVAEVDQNLRNSSANVQTFSTIKQQAARQAPAERQALAQKQNQQKHDEEQRRLFGRAPAPPQPRAVDYATFKNLLNSWTIQQLKRELDGVGPTTARNMVSYRDDTPFAGTTQEGIFAELKGVSGVGDSLANKIMRSLTNFQTAGGGGASISGRGSSHASGMSVEERRRHVDALTAQLIGLQARTLLSSGGGGRRRAGNGRGGEQVNSLMQGILQAVAARRR
jgi:DNA uptake protein ComE-like DNA-binding protein